MKIPKPIFTPHTCSGMRVLRNKAIKSPYEFPQTSLQINISEEIRDLTAKDIGQKLGTLGRHMGHWADIKNIKQTYGTLSGNWGHWADIGQTLGRHWADIWQTLI